MAVAGNPDGNPGVEVWPPGTRLDLGRQAGTRALGAPWALATPMLQGTVGRQGQVLFFPGGK